MYLTKKDYLKILDFYGIKYINTTSFTTIQSKAEKILAEKLCRCIKKVKLPNDILEQRSIGICHNSVLKKKGLKSGRFKCKKRPKFLKNKTTRRKLTKIK